MTFKNFARCARSVLGSHLPEGKVSKLFHHRKLTVSGQGGVQIWYFRVSHLASTLNQLRTSKMTFSHDGESPWRKQARKRGGAKGSVGADGSTQHGGHKRAHCATTAPTAGIQPTQGELQTNQLKKRKNNDVEYERQYPERTQDQARRGEGPDRPKRKRVDGAVCYANSGEGAKRRCDATGRPPGRPPG